MPNKILQGSIMLVGKKGVKAGRRDAEILENFTNDLLQFSFLQFQKITKVLFTIKMAFESQEMPDSSLPSCLD
jgi:hypothetical protein